MSKPDGLYEKHYGNGEVEKINYKNGKEEGLYESYYKNGQLKEKGNTEDHCSQLKS